jgi:hypothetical protein
MGLKDRGAAAGGLHLIRAAVNGVGQRAAIAFGAIIRIAFRLCDWTIKGVIRDRAKIAVIACKLMPGQRTHRAAAPAVALGEIAVKSLAGAGMLPVSNA